MVSSPVLGTGEEERYQTLCGEMMMSKEAVLVKIVALSALVTDEPGKPDFCGDHDGGDRDVS